MLAASQTILDTSQTREGEARLVKALSRLVDWLGSWPTSQLSSFILDILMRVGQERTAVLAAVTEVTIANLALRLPLTVFRKAVEPVFFFLLYGYQHSVTAFHSVAASLPAILTSLASQVTTTFLYLNINIHILARVWTPP